MPQEKGKAMAKLDNFETVAIGAGDFHAIRSALRDAHEKAGDSSPYGEALQLARAATRKTCGACGHRGHSRGSINCALS